MRSTPSPYEIFRSVKLELRPAFLRPMHTPSKAWMRSRSPSTTLRLTFTVSPGEKSGIVRPASSFSICWVSSVLSTVMASPLSSVLSLGPGALREPAVPQIRAALPRHPLPLLLPPLADPVVVTGEQHLRHRAAFPILRPRVVRIFEEAILETLLRERRLVPDDARQ